MHGEYERAGALDDHRVGPRHPARQHDLIVNRADTFGLAQLYQLRGRVGRSHHRAYAYLLIPGEHLITTDAQKRLRVLQELDELGGGFRLAAHDLEIRGAGNLLGKQQSGHITAVGLELYTQHAGGGRARAARRAGRAARSSPRSSSAFPAFIPETYVPDVNQRLVLYKRLAGIRGVPDLRRDRATSWSTASARFRRWSTRSSR